MLMLAVVVALCVVSSVVAETLLTKSYYNDENTPFNPEFGNVEYHCISLNSVDNKPYYVRGTYGKRGYFEGYINDYVANVNWWEVTMGGNALTPSNGAAVLTYSEDYSSVEGTFWNSGECDIYDSSDSWGITGVCEDCFENITSIEGCFYDPSNKLNDEANTLINRGHTNNMIFGEETNPNVFNHIGIGNAETGGHVVGGYVYEYSEEECEEFELSCEEDGRTETGHYGLHGISANGRSLNIIATIWSAATGPAAGSYGSSLYALVPTPSEGEEDFVLYGWFCNEVTSEEVDDSEGGAQLEDCTWESGDFMTRDKGMALKLLSPYNLLNAPTAAKNDLGMLRSFTDLVWPRPGNFLKEALADRVRPFLEYFITKNKT